MTNRTRKYVIKRKIPSAPAAENSKTRKRQSFKKTDILRAMDAAKAGGLDIGIVEVTPDGAIRMATIAATGNGKHDLFSNWEDRL